MHLDLLILGAGVNGLLSALQLARVGLRVGVVERGEPGRESTWAGAGILSPLLPWDYGAEVNALCARGVALWPGWIEALRDAGGVDPEYSVCGMWVHAVADRPRALAWCRAHGWRAEAPSSAPAVVADADDGIWLPDVAQVRNPRLARALTEACVAAGVRLWPNTPALGWDVRGDSVAALRTSAGMLTADRYVVCAGAWSRDLLPEAPALPEIHPVRGQMLLFRAAPGLLPCVLYRDGHYLVPRRDGLILAGSTLEHVGFDKSVTTEALAELREFALGTLPALEHADLVGQWAGLRPGTPDNVPCIAAHPRLHNLFLNSGQYRYGVTMAPACAELLADLILERPPRLDPIPYRWP
jgi:glycine oxidase